MATAGLRCLGLASLVCVLGLLSGCPGDGGSTGRAADAGAESDEHDHSEADGGKDEDKPSGGKAGSPSKPTKPAQGGAGGAGGKPSEDQDGEDGPKTPEKPSTPGQGTDASGAHFFLPTGEPTNTTAPKLLADAKGGTHMLYPKYGSGGAFYAYCPDGCKGYDDVQPVLLETDGTVGNAALALTSDGKPRALLSTLLRVYYAQCDANCTDQDSWTITPIIEHQGDQDVTGQALALDPQDHPRFIMHTYLAYLGVGQKPPKTWYVQCDSNCNEPSSWTQSVVSEDKISANTQLLFDRAGVAHALTAIENADGMSAGLKLAAYMECASDCTSADAWNGVGLAELYDSIVEEIKPSLSLALTKDGKPRVLFLERGGPNNKRLLYFECDGQCTEDNWTGSALSDLSQLRSGVDLVLDAQDHPRFVFTLDYNIGLYSCDSPSCAQDDSKWELTKVEFASDLPKDNIILWPNCTVDAWILHKPSLALGKNGTVRIGYEATDLSGGVKVIDPNMSSCVAGKDMTLSRMTLLAADAPKK